MSADGEKERGRYRQTRTAIATQVRAVRAAVTAAARQHTPVLDRFTRQMISVNVLDTATRIGAQVFLTAIPVLFVIAAFSPMLIRDQLLASLRTVVGLQGASLDELRQVYSSSSQNVRQAYGEIGILITVLSATACSRALQRLCERSWHVAHASVRVVAWRWLAWFCVWLVALITQNAISRGLGTGDGLGIPLSLTTSALLWWWTQHLLLGGRIGWLPLLPGAVLTGCGTVALFWASRLYMPRTLARSITQFGPLGSVFTVLSWIIVVCIVISVGIAAGYVVAHEQPVAGWLRIAPASVQPPPPQRVDD
jgi:membrane protein